MKLRRYLWLIATIIFLVAIFAWIILTNQPAATITATQPLPASATPSPPTSTPAPWQVEPIVPTAIPDTPQTVGTTATTIARTAEPTVNVATSPASLESLNSEALNRFGLGVPYPPMSAETAETLGLGWYLSWRVSETPDEIPDLEFWQMIRLQETGHTPDSDTLVEIAETYPGSTWLIGNEPDVIWQDNVTPERYAELYHDLYYLLKETDPTAQIAIGGITQPTPIRLQYLEIILETYETRYNEPMPVDIWNIHNFILREERASWGVDIPPGLTMDEGILFEIEDHDDMTVFKDQIIGFRQWMADRGERNKPLIVSEYGILMPTDYGFEFERVQTFLYNTYDFMLTATDDDLGYPADNNHLVQRWAWYSLSDDLYATGNFINLESGELTDLGRAHQAYIKQLP